MENCDENSDIDSSTELNSITSLECSSSSSGLKNLDDPDYIENREDIKDIKNIEKIDNFLDEIYNIIVKQINIQSNMKKYQYNIIEEIENEQTINNELQIIINDNRDKDNRDNDGGNSNKIIDKFKEKLYCKLNKITLHVKIIDELNIAINYGKTLIDKIDSFLRELRDEKLTRYFNKNMNRVIKSNNNFIKIRDKEINIILSYIKSN